MLWFVKKNEDGEDAELLIGVYSGETEAMAAIERLKGRAGFAEFPQGFEIHPYEIDHDPWIEGFVRG